MSTESLKCPWPYFGGKSKVAALVWKHLGDVDNAIEPFCGSMAVLLSRPFPRGVETANDASLVLSNFDRAVHPERGDPCAVADFFCEVANDADPYLANAWRSIRQEPEETAAWADSQVNEAMLHAVHRWLVLGDEAEEFRRRMRTDPDYYCPRRAGRWIYGICAWIGGGWCSTPKEVDRNSGATPALAGSDGNGQKVHRLLEEGTENRRPVIANPGSEHGKGVHGDALCEKAPRNFSESYSGRGGSMPGVHADPKSKVRIASHNKGSVGKGVHAQGQVPNLSGDSGAAGRGVHAGGRVPGLRDLLPQAEQCETGGIGVHGVGPSAGGRPQLADAYDVGRGVHSNGELGTCEARRAWLCGWFCALRDRLRNVRVCCGDWLRVCSSDSVTVRLGTTGVFLDPPYPKKRADGKKSRADSLYATDAAGNKSPEQIRDEVLEWSRPRGPDHRMRICIAGYEGDGYEALVAECGWREVAWKAQGGYGNRTEEGQANASRERLWFSPHCRFEKGLFDDLEATT